MDLIWILVFGHRITGFRNTVFLGLVTLPQPKSQKQSLKSVGTMTMLLPYIGDRQIDRWCICTTPLLFLVTSLRRFSPLLWPLEDSGSCKFVWTSRCSILTCTIYHHRTHPNVTLAPFLYVPWFSMYMLNDVLCNAGTYTNGYSVCLHPYVYWKMEAYQNVTPVILATGVDWFEPRALAIHRVMTMTPQKNHSSVLLYTFVRNHVLDTIPIHMFLG